MLVATLEIWPHGDDERHYEVHRVFIANLGRQNAEAKAGDPWTNVYDYAIWMGSPDEVQRTVPDVHTVFQHDRMYGPSRCLHEGLVAHYGGTIPF